MTLDAQRALWPLFTFCWKPPAAPGGTAIPGPRPDVVQAPEARHGTKMRLINWMVYDHRIRD